MPIKNGTEGKIRWIIAQWYQGKLTPDDAILELATLGLPEDAWEHMLAILQKLAPDAADAIRTQSKQAAERVVREVRDELDEAFEDSSE